MVSSSFSSQSTLSNWRQLLYKYMMENNGAGVVGRLQSRLTIKVHATTCTGLQNFIGKVSKIIPEIEATRPRASGMEALCVLNNGIAKAKSLVQQCTECSKLYLVLRGDAFVSRCKKSMNLLESSLGEILDMVPIVLADKISGIITALRTSVFPIEPHEEEAGKILEELLYNYSSTIDSSEEFAISAIQAVCSRLRISSPKAIAIEQRSIRKMLNKLGQNDWGKRKILTFFVVLLKKYRNIITTSSTATTTTTEDIDVSESSSFASPYSWERVTSIYSVSNFGSSMNDLNLPVDFNNLSLGYDDQSEHSVRCVGSSSNNAVEDVKRLLNISEKSWSMMPFGKFIDMLLRFLKDARERRDVEAQITGLRCLLELVQKNRTTISYMKENAFAVLASFLDKEVIAEEALSILEVLSSFHQHCGTKFAASGALVHIFKLLESPNQEFLERALNILINLSASRDSSSFIVPSELIAKLTPLFENNSTLTRSYCTTILKNLCENGASIHESDGCVMIRLVAKLLTNGGREEQEHALSVLVHLCSQRARYCQMVMDEEVITVLFDVCVNGNGKAMAMARELMRFL